MSKLHDAIMGLVVGDALGVPVEFKQRDTYQVTDMIGYGTYNQPPGTWSDDSSMTLATLESIGRLGKIDPTNIMGNFFRWLEHADFTPWGKVFDVGTGTQRAISRYAKGIPVSRCGGDNIRDNGNGSLMRILPLALVPHTGRDIIDVSSLTHAHSISQNACLIYVSISDHLLAGESKEQAVAKGIQAITSEEYARLPEIHQCERGEIKSTGYVVDTLEAALWCFLNTDNYRDCVLTAVNLGDDTDTVAAIAGGLAGILYGVGGDAGIPEQWISNIARQEWIRQLCENVEHTFSE